MTWSDCRRLSVVLVWWVAQYPDLSGLAAQESTTRPAQGGPTDDLQASYQEARAAKTVDELTAAIERCQQAGERAGTETRRQYLKQLTAWLYNRRGEQYVAAAGTLRDDPARQQQLDDLALADFERAVATDASRWKALHNRGVSYALAGRADDALRDFVRVSELKPDYPNAWFNQGEILFERRRYPQALSRYERALKLQPTDATAEARRGSTLFQLRRFPEALAAFRKAVELAPQDAGLRVDRGDAYRSLGMWRPAADDYRQAITLDDQLARAYLSAAWLMSVCPREEFRNAELGVATARKALELTGQDDFLALDTLAAAYANAGQFTEATAAQQRAVAAAPAAEQPRLQQRLTLYRQQQPYREQPDRAIAR